MEILKDMVKFFDQKEEVISIELTPYGKEKFASGSFSPKHYAFYDEAILYDGTYANIAESQNQIVDRIKNSTPRLHPLAKFTSSLAPVVSLGPESTSAGMFSENSIWNASFFRFLGKGSPWAQNIPAWDIRITPSSDRSFETGVDYSVNNSIPAMSATLEINYVSFDIPNTNNKTYSLIASDNLILNVQEINSVFKGSGNFDIQVLLSSSADNSFRHIPLGFIKQGVDKSNILLDQVNDPLLLAQTIYGNDQEIKDGFPLLDHTYSEFYLNISVDDEISGRDMTPGSTMYDTTRSDATADICQVLEDSISDDFGNEGR